jgi:hypothetical protein
MEWWEERGEASGGAAVGREIAFGPDLLYDECKAEGAVLRRVRA